jgi:hypothetical protein
VHRYFGPKTKRALSIQAALEVVSGIGRGPSCDARARTLSSGVIQSPFSEIEMPAGQDPGCKRLMTVPGIGPIISTTMVAAVVPRQISTGDRTILGKMSRRGNRYLRVLFVRAAWIVPINPQTWERHGLKHWTTAAKRRRHHSALAIALANKLARISWLWNAAPRSGGLLGQPLNLTFHELAIEPLAQN